MLAAIVVVALKGMLKQGLELPSIFRECSVHGFIWLITFLATILMDIEYGLGIGMAVSLLNLIWRSNKSTLSVLGSYKHSELYVDISQSEQVTTTNYNQIKFKNLVL